MTGSIAHRLSEQAESLGDALAYRFLRRGVASGSATEQRTYRSLLKRAQGIGSHLTAKGWAGERVLLLYPASLDFCDAFFACAWAGSVAVPLPAPTRRSVEGEVARIESVVASCDPVAVLTTSSIVAAADSTRQRHATLSALPWIATDELSSVATHESDHPSVVPGQLALLQYTSGSTGDPKGVMVTHANLLANVEAFAQALRIQSDDHAVSWLPNHHDMGLLGFVVAPVCLGVSATHLAPQDFLRDPLWWLRTLSETHATITAAPNFAYEYCARRAQAQDIASLDLGHLKVACVGAEPVRASTLDAFAERFRRSGFRRSTFLPCYGLAESTLFVAGALTPRPVIQGFARQNLRAGELRRSERAATDLVSSGRPADQHTVRVVDPTTLKECAAGTIGELWVAGPSVAAGYWGRKAQTAETFGATDSAGDGPYLRTGDLGAVLDGELYVTGRLKDLIILRGRNLYPQDLELTVGRSHEGLSADGCAAFSVTSDDGEEQLCIVAECARTQDHEAVLGAIRSALFSEHECVPQEVVLTRRRAIARTTSGKVRRHAYRDAWIASSLPAIARWVRPEVNRDLGRDAGYRGGTLRTQLELEKWLVGWMSRRCGFPTQRIDVKQPLAFYGLDSLALTELHEDLEGWLQQPVPQTLLFDMPSARDAAEHLTKRHGAAASVSEPDLKGIDPAEPIAVVGIGCRFPGDISTAEAFWELLREGRSAVSEVPPDRWNVDSYYDPDPAALGKMSSRWLGSLGDVAGFDVQAFGLASREVENMDPQHRLLLEVTWEALERAGRLRADGGDTTTSVYVGLSNTDYRDLVGEVGAHTATGVSAATAAGRLSYTFGLVGEAAVVDTACSSSLVAVHLACRSLADRDSNVAVAAGVNLVLTPGTSISLSKLGAFAADGRCKTFDASADGYVRGEGCGVVVLRRLADATRDGDPVLAVIRGTAANQDGRTQGLTAPSRIAQERVIRAAMSRAGIDPRTVDYVEAHGTGTPLGDPIELAALNAVLGPRSEGSEAVVGSVKPNIGHLEAAAGIAGLIKAVLVLREGQVPPLVNLETPTPRFAWRGASLCVRPGHTAPRPRRVGVSSFGFSGTNAHVVLEAAPAEQSVEPTEPRWHLLPFSASTPHALDNVVERFVRAGRAGERRLADVSHTLQNGRRALRYRRVCIAKSIDAASQALRAGDSAQVVEGHVATPLKGVAFAFPGGGVQYPGMGAGLYRTQPVFRDAVDEGLAFLGPTGEAIRRAWLPRHAGAGAEKELSRPPVQLPALFIAELALARLWLSWGVRPDAVIGHSLGQTAAACLAQVFSFEDGVKLARLRGELMEDTPAGSTIAISLTEAELQPQLLPNTEIAAVNAPELCAVSGDAAAVAELSRRLTEGGVGVRALHIPAAAHSYLLEDALPRFRAGVEAVELQAPAIPLISNLSGQFITLDEAIAPDYWVEHLRRPVRFSRGLETLTHAGVGTFLETGPGRALSVLTAMQDFEVQAVPGMRAAGDRDDDEVVALRALGHLWSQGHELRWQHIDQARSVELPTYPFERTRHWCGTTGLHPGAARMRDGAPCRAEWHARPRRASASVPQLQVIFLAGRCIDQASMLDAFERLGLPVNQVLRSQQPADLEEALTRTGNDGIIVHELEAIPAGGDGNATPIGLARAAALAWEPVAGILASRDRADVSLTLVTCGGRMVRGEESLVDQAVLAGLFGSGPFAVRGRRHIDLPRRPMVSDLDVAADLIASETASGDCAIRGGCCYEQSFAPIVHDQGEQLHFRSDRAYLVGGGSSELRGLIADWLAERGAGEVIASASPSDPSSEPESEGAQRARAHPRGHIALSPTAAERPLGGMIHLLQERGGELAASGTAAVDRALRALLTLDAIVSGHPVEHFVLLSEPDLGCMEIEDGGEALSDALASWIAASRWRTGQAATVVRLFPGASTTQDGRVSLFGALDHALLTGAREVLVPDPAATGKSSQSNDSESRPAPDEWALGKPQAAFTVPDGLVISECDRKTRETVLCEALIRNIRDVLRAPGVQPETPLDGLGFDSLMALELKKRIEAALPVTMPVRALWECATPRELASSVADSWLGSADDAGAGGQLASDGDTEDFVI